MSKIYKYNDIIDYSNNSIISKNIHKSKSGSITLFSFDKNQSLSPHSAPYDAYVNVIEGKAKINISGDDYILEKNENITMPANIEHSIIAEEKFKMLLVMIKDY